MTPTMVKPKILQQIFFLGAIPGKSFFLLRKVPGNLRIANAPELDLIMVFS
jgi:hypothetical protein